MASFQILTVCTGNVCRSPMAEVMLRAALSDLPGVTVEVASAGTGALEGYGMPVEAVAVLAGLGLADEPPHVARQINPLIIRQADLVLALTRAHRKSVVQVDAAAMKRTFTLREFGYLVGGLSDELVAAARPLLLDQAGQPESLIRLRAAVMAASAVAAEAVPTDQAEYDVIDPFGQPLKAYAATARRMIPAIEAMAEFCHHLLNSAG